MNCVCSKGNALLEAVLKECPTNQEIAAFLRKMQMPDLSAFATTQLNPAMTANTDWQHSVARIIGEGKDMDNQASRTNLLPPEVRTMRIRRESFRIFDMEYLVAAVANCSGFALNKFLLNGMNNFESWKRDKQFALWLEISKAILS